MTDLETARRGMRPTMRHVADLAGVSLKTVSRVINGEQGVTAAVEVKVMTAARQLNYRHDVAASSLRRTGRTTASIGIVLEDVGNPFSSALNRAIENAASARGMLVFAGSSDEDPQRQQHLVNAFSGRHVDGMILVPAGTDHEYLVAEQRNGTPIVFVDRPTSSLDVDSVVSDNTAGAFAGVTHLVQAGHRRIGFLGDLESIVTAEQRYLGYVEALGVAGLNLDERLVRRGLRSSDAAAPALHDLLRETDPPTAIFTSQNLVTIGAIRALHACGLEGSIALVGFDEVTLADLLKPGITVVAQDPLQLGHVAAELLFARIDGDRSAFRQIVVPTTLITRGSGEIRPR